MKSAVWFLGILGLAVSGFAGPDPAAHPGRVLHEGALGDPKAWTVEQVPGGTVTFGPEGLLIDDRGGCTVWFRTPLSAPVVIRFSASVSSRGRVSDLNCFWMATAPGHPKDLFAPGHGRDGRFATYDTLRTYYVGYGGNGNTTTRFRRYDGAGNRPLLPAHDLSHPGVLLRPDEALEIVLIVTGDGRIQYLRNGEVLFDVVDSEPLTRGWFGFRTVDSRIHVSAFSVHEALPPEKSRSTHRRPEE